MKDLDLRETFRVEPGRKVKLKNFDTGWAHAKKLGGRGKDAAKRDAEELLERSRKELAGRRTCSRRTTPGRSW